MAKSKKYSNQTSQIINWDREKLEDAYFKTSSNLEALKVHAIKQEDKIKHLTIKFKTLHKKLELHNISSKITTNVNTIETSNNVHKSANDEQLNQIKQLQLDKDVLKKKLHHINQQFKLYVKRAGVSPTVSKTVSSAETKSRIELRRLGHVTDKLSSENHSLLEEIKSKDEMINVLKEEIEKYNMEIKNMDIAQENQLLKLKEHMSSSQRITVNENIELIKVKREIKEKSAAFSKIENRYITMQKDYERMRIYIEELNKEKANLQSQLARNEATSIISNTKMQQLSSLTNGGNYSERCKFLEKELEILQQTNNKLANSAFDVDQEKKWRELERRLRSQIALLEASIKSDAVEKNSLIDKMSNEQDYMKRLNDDCRNMRQQYERLGNENIDLRKKLQLLSAIDSEVEADDLREALIMLRKKQDIDKLKEKPDYVEVVDEKFQSYKEQQELLAKTSQELNKTREMLVMQHKINKDYHQEIVAMTKKQDETKRSNEEKLKRLAENIDRKSTRIKTLEGQLRDVAYGTKQFKLKNQLKLSEKIDSNDLDSTCDEQELVELKRGENLLEINISNVLLNASCMNCLGNNPSIFVTHAFYDFEIVSTQVLSATNAHFNFTSQYKIKVDEIFLNYLCRTSTKFEVHLAKGVDYETVGSCKVTFDKLLDSPQAKMYASGTLTGTDGSTIGIMDYWVRLRVPMEQAIRLYQSKLKALGYISTSVGNNTLLDDDVTISEPKTLTPNQKVNKLHVTIHNCSDITLMKNEVQPDVYCVYKLFDFSNHATSIVPSSNYPVFNDHQTFTIAMSSSFHLYLQTEKLLIYVFDDKDSDLTTYIGKAAIDLIPLAYNDSINGPIEIFNKEGIVNGTIQVEIKWQHDYENTANDLISPEPKKSAVSKIDEVFPNTPAKPPRKKKVIPTNPLPKPTSPPPNILNDLEDANPKVDEKLPDVKSVESDNGSKDNCEDQVEDSNVFIEQQINEVTESADNVDQMQHNEESFIKTVDTAEESTSSNGGSGIHPVPLPRTKVSKTHDEAESVHSETKDESGHFESEDVSVKPVDEILDEGKNPFDEDTKSEDESEIEEEIAVLPNEKDEEEIFSSGGLTGGENEDTYFSDMKNSTVAGQHRVRFVDDEADKSDENLQNEKELENTEESNEITVLEVNEAHHNENNEKQDDALKVNQNTINKDDSLKLRVSVNHLTLNDSQRWLDNNIDHVFVEYDILGNVHETPQSIPIPRLNGERMLFNHTSETNFENEETRHLLARMLQGSSSDFKVLLLSDPVDDNDRDCEEIGSATVDLAEIVRNQDNIIGRELVVSDGAGEIVGKINMDVECYQLLQSVLQENQVLKE